MKKDNGNKFKRGFELGTLIFWLALFFFFTVGVVYKNAHPRIQNAPKDRTPDIDKPIKRMF